MDFKYKLEYICVLDDNKFCEEIENQINSLAKDDWELVQLDTSLLQGAADGYGIFRKRVSK